MSSLLQMLKEQRDVLKKSVDVAMDATTHADAKQEGKYDTRAIEAGYIAGAQKERLQQLDNKINYLLNMRENSSSTKIGSGSLVHLKSISEDSQSRWYFVTQLVGGEIVNIDHIKYIVVTVDSDVGQELVGCEKSDEVFLFLPSGAEQSFLVADVV